MYPLIEVQFASNTIEMLNAIYNVVSFEIIPWIIMGPIQSFFIGTFPSDIPFNNGFSRLGFGTSYIAINLFPPVFMLVLFSVYFTYSWLRSKYGKEISKRRTRLENAKSSFPFYLRFVIELSYEVGVCSMIEIVMRQVETPKERISYYISVISLISIVWLNYSLWRMIKKKFYKINNPKYPRFNMYWGEIWSELRVRKDNLPLFNLIFMIRRLLMAFIIVAPAAIGIPSIF